MTDLPYQEWYEADFSSDPFVMSLSFDARCVWRCVLQKMWANGGWLPADDLRLARLLGCDVRTWRRYKPLLEKRLLREVSDLRSETFLQKRVRSDWGDALERQARRKARTAAATAERIAKSRKRPHVTVGNSKDRNGQRNVDPSCERNGSAPARGPSNKEDLSAKAERDLPYAPSQKNNPAPPEDVSVARDLGIAPSPPPAPAASRKPPPASRHMHRRNDEDLPPSPGPGGQTAFMKRFEAFKAGDASAIDPLPGVPNNTVNPALAAKIRQQLGLEPREENNADPQADADDDGLVQRFERAPPPEGPHPSEAGTPLDQAASAPGDDRAEHADPRKPDDDDDDISGLFKF